MMSDGSEASAAIADRLIAAPCCTIPHSRFSHAQIELSRHDRLNRRTSFEITRQCRREALAWLQPRLPMLPALDLPFFHLCIAAAANRRDEREARRDRKFVIFEGVRNPEGHRDALRIREVQMAFEDVVDELQGRRGRLAASDGRPPAHRRASPWRSLLLETPSGRATSSCSYRATPRFWPAPLRLGCILGAHQGEKACGSCRAAFLPSWSFRWPFLFAIEPIRQNFRDKTRRRPGVFTRGLVDPRLHMLRNPGRYDDSRGRRLFCSCHCISTCDRIRFIRA